MGQDPPPPRAVSPEYDPDPGRFRLARSVQRRHACAPDVHAQVAGRLRAERFGEILTDVNVERWDAPPLELPSVAFARKRGARRRPRPKRWR